MTPNLRLNLRSRGDVALGGARFLAELLPVDAGALLELGRAALGALDLLDERAELHDDLVDRLLVEAHLLERLDHLVAVRVDLGLDALLARRGARLELLDEVLRDLVEVLHLVDEAEDAAVRLLLVELARRRPRRRG